MAGGSESGARIAELLATAGADVVILSNDLCEEMVELFTRGSASGTLRLERRRWTTTDLAGKAIAVLDTVGETEAASFAAIGRAVGTPVNVIDRPEHCDVQFEAVVSRSPVVAGSSTDETPPILAHAIRRRIETILLASSGQWGWLMRRLRARLTHAMPDRATRPSFPKRLAAAAFRSEPVRAADLDAWAAEVHSKAPGGGSVALVGAGPGDAKYLTLEAVRALQSADVVLHDALVSDDVLKLAGREARRVPVGKRAARESFAQSNINTLLVELAQSGHRVVRLKSGDPTVFGRAGEEIDACIAAGVAVEIVPGVTTALALAARLGVSLTHRDHARSVRFVTGHSRHGALPDDIDWAGLADGVTTLVFYMGARVGPQIAAHLLAHGLSSDTPAIVAASVAAPGETIWQGVLGDIEDGLARTGIDRPVVIAIGRALGAVRPAAPCSEGGAPGPVGGEREQVASSSPPAPHP